LPPQLLDATLNSQPLGNDPSELPEPNHVLLNHLYALSVKDNVMVLGTTNRFKTKYVTTVLYKPLGT
jgi:5'-AMP-activated protein kinase regulatory beta subunit